MASSTSEWMNVTQAVEQWTEFQESYVKQISNFFSANPVGASANQSWSDWLTSGMLDSIPNYTMLLFTQPDKWGATESSLAALMKATYERLASSQSGAFDAIVAGTGKALEIAQTSQSSPDMIAKLIDNQLNLMESLKTQQENWFGAFTDLQAGLNAWSYKQLSSVTEDSTSVAPKAAPKTVAKKEEAKPTTAVKPKAEATAVKSVATAELAPAAKKEVQPQAKVTKPAAPKAKAKATKKATPAKAVEAKAAEVKAPEVTPAVQAKAPEVKPAAAQPATAKAADVKPAATPASAAPAATTVKPVVSEPAKTATPKVDAVAAPKAEPVAKVDTAPKASAAPAEKSPAPTAAPSDTSAQH